MEASHSSPNLTVSHPPALGSPERRSIEHHVSPQAPASVPLQTLARIDPAITSSAPVSRHLTPTEEVSGFDFPALARSTTIHGNTSTIPVPPAVAGSDRLPIPLPAAPVQQHHHRHGRHHHPIQLLNAAEGHPDAAFSLGSARLHDYPSYYPSPYYTGFQNPYQPRKTQEPIFSLGRPLPTYEELQRRKYDKSHRGKADLERKNRYGQVKASASETPDREWRVGQNGRVGPSHGGGSGQGTPRGGGVSDPQVRRRKPQLPLNPGTAFGPSPASYDFAPAPQIQTDGSTTPQYLLASPEMIRAIVISALNASKVSSVPPRPADHAHAPSDEQRTQTGVDTGVLNPGPRNAAEGHGSDRSGKTDQEDETSKSFSAFAARRDTTSSVSSTSTSSSSSEDTATEFPNPWCKIRHVLREPFAEFVGTCLLIVFGDGVSSQVTLSSSTSVGPTGAKGEYLSISWGWGIGVMMGVYAAGGISGGHINPAVTISLATFRKFPWKKVPGYILAQIFGATAGAAIVYANYVNAINLYEGAPNRRTVTGKTSTAGLFSTYPLEYVTDVSAFFNEFIDTVILLLIILAIGDRNNTPPPDGLNPLVLLFLVVGLGACMGMQTGYAVNPARDFGPRLFTYAVGYGKDVWNFRSQYWLWTPWLATVSGGLVGCLIYDLLIYTGAESPINRPWKWTLWGTGAKRARLGFGDSTKEKLPAGQDKV